MSVAGISGPELLDAPLRTIQMPVNQQGVGVGADLRRDPGGQPYQGGRQRLPETKDSLQARKADLYSLPEPPPLAWFGTQEDAYLGQSLPQFLVPVGQVAQESASYPSASDLNLSSMLPLPLTRPKVRLLLLPGVSHNLECFSPARACLSFPRKGLCSP